MEYALRDSKAALSDVAECVLILVLMEYALRDASNHKSK